MLQYLEVESSNIAKVAYDQGRSALHVLFKSPSEYVYAGVPLAKFGELLAAESKGQFLNKQIKPFFKFTRVEPAAA